MSDKKALISQTRGKFQAAGVLFILGGIVASASGLWWGPALLFPGALLMIFGWF